jgi:hypothetical protein
VELLDIGADPVVDTEDTVSATAVMDMVVSVDMVVTDTEDTDLVDVVSEPVEVTDTADTVSVLDVVSVLAEVTALEVVVSEAGEVTDSVDVVLVMDLVDVDSDLAITDTILVLSLVSTNATLAGELTAWAGVPLDTITAISLTFSVVVICHGTIVMLPPLLLLSDVKSLATK